MSTEPHPTGETEPTHDHHDNAGHRATRDDRAEYSPAEPGDAERTAADPDRAERTAADPDRAERPAAEPGGTECPAADPDGAGHPAARPGRAERQTARRSRKRRIAAAVALAVAGALAAGGLTAPEIVATLTGRVWQLAAPATPAPREVSPMPTAATPPAGVTPSVRASRSVAAVTASPASATPVLRMPGSVPATGPGTFAYAAGYGRVSGWSGALRRYRVAVEIDVGTDVQDFAEMVDLVLGDPRSWIGSGRLRLQRVPARGVSYDFTIYLATAQTAGRMCAAGGVDIRVDGKPYTSCRSGGKVVVNLDRWLLSVDHFVAAGVPLHRYREYVINHEVGHALGHSHERCPGKGRPAPTMMKQTLSLDGCLPNPWPYVGGERYQGPPL